MMMAPEYEHTAPLCSAFFSLPLGLSARALRNEEKVYNLRARDFFFLFHCNYMGKREKEETQ